MTRWQILLWLDRYTKRLAFENSASENGAGGKENPDEMHMTLDKDSAAASWDTMFPPKSGTVKKDGGYYSAG